MVAVIQLDRDEPVTIGRATDCRVVLPSTAVSRKHATITVEPDGRVQIRDEGSANGVQVDGSYITAPTIIDTRSRIRISSFTLQLDTRLPDSAPEAAGESSFDDEEGETILEAQLDAGVRLAAGALALVGRSGRFAGETLTLDRPLLTLGRVPECDLTVDDPSISRQHAQLRLGPAGDRFTVLDLRSSNGTFVDGQRVKRAECHEGNVVRFGDIPFRVRLSGATDVARPGKRRRAPMGSRAKVLWAAGLVVLVLVAVVLVATLRHPPEEERRAVDAAEKLRQLQQRVQRQVEQGKRSVAQRRWSTAIQALDSALREDPLNKTARQLRQRALAELEHKRTFSRGVELASLGGTENLNRARKVLQTIPDSSAYHRDARYRLQRVDEQLAEGYRVEGVSRCKARYWGRCQAALCQYFRLLPEDKLVAGERRLRALLRRAERHLRRRRDHQPCDAPRFLHPPQGEQAGASVSEALAQRYPDSRVRAVVELYLEGKLAAALKRLQRLQRSRRLRPQWADLRELNRRMLVVRGKYQEGFSALRARNLELCAKQWGTLLEVDGEIVPDGVESPYRSEVKRSLGDLYYSEGDEAFKVSRYREAFNMWSRGKQLNPAHDRLLNGLLRLESVAVRLIREASQLRESGRRGEAREKLDLALAITAPERPVHQEANAARKGL